MPPAPKADRYGTRIAGEVSRRPASQRAAAHERDRPDDEAADDLQIVHAASREASIGAAALCTMFWRMPRSVSSEAITFTINAIASDAEHARCQSASPGC
jgi:hypothetical protein